MTLSRILCNQLRGETRGSQTHQQLTDSRVWPEYRVPRPSDQDPVTMLHTQNSPPRFYYCTSISLPTRQRRITTPHHPHQKRELMVQNTPLETILVRYRYIGHNRILYISLLFIIILLCFLEGLRS